MSTDAAGGASPATLLTQKQYADLKGWTRQYVHQLVRQGRIRLHDGRIDVTEADAAMARQRDPARDRRLAAADTRLTDGDDDGDPTGGASASFVRARTVREHYRARREKAEYELLVGKLVDMDDVRNAGFELGFAIRRTFDEAAHKVGEAFATELNIEVSQATRIAQGPLRTALEELRRFAANMEFDLGKQV
jgi:hypothetical protein